MTVSQAHSDAPPQAAAGASGARRNWWLTLPELLTGLAGVISAGVGLVVAVHQLRPGHTAGPTTKAIALPVVLTEGDK